MEELVGWLAALLFIVVVVGFVIWVLVATVVRIFAWVLVFWIASFAIGFAAGILVGVVLPPRVLRNKAAVEPEIATPDQVVGGKVLRAPKGPSAHFGWDRAWPVYNPHQAKRDAWAVIRQIGPVVSRPFKPVLGKDGWPFLAVLLFPYVGYALGAWLSIAVWSLVMAFLGGLLYLVQQSGVLVYRWQDRLIRRRRKAVLRCTKCYRLTMTPTYRCANPECTTMHHDVTPGPLGIVHRRCGCGTSFPTTVGAAAKRLVTVCPYCLHEVPKGSGTRRVLPVPVIGARGVGKTQFLSSGVVALARLAQRCSGSLTAVSPVAETFIKNASAVIASGQRVQKTEWKDRPEGVPLILTLPGKELEVQLMDAAGENFVDWERSQALSYIDTADVLFFFLDPLALPEMTELLQVTNQTGVVPVADGDPEDSYASVVDRLRANNIRLDAKSLAVIVTKVDVLKTLPGSEDVVPPDGDSVRRWLVANRADGLVRRIDRDFKRVSYFAVDSYGQQDPFDASHPLRVFDWALRTTDPRLSVMPDTVVAGNKEGSA